MLARVAANHPLSMALSCSDLHPLALSPPAGHPTKPHPRDTTWVDPSPSCPSRPPPCNQALRAARCATQSPHPTPRPVCKGAKQAIFDFFFFFPSTAPVCAVGEVMDLRVMQIGAVLRHF